VDLYGDLVEQYLEFSARAGDESPCFAEWAARTAGDPDVLEWLSRLPRLKQQPNLVFAAARWHGVPAPGPYAGLRNALLSDDGAVLATIRTRATQTNEVGRLATLVPVFALAARDAGEPLALVEVGPSAGLCLFPDRYRYRWQGPDGETTLGDGPELVCEVSGPALLPTAVPRVSWRAGVDLNPLSVRDADAMAWLETLVWPEQEHRRVRLHAAIEIAAAEPPYLVRGDLLDELPALVEEAQAFGRVVVFHTAVLPYLDEAARRRFADLMTGMVAADACHWVCNEGRRVLPGVTATAVGTAPPPGLEFVLGLDGQALAWTHGHGRALHWGGPDRAF
jgi:hypothetical protein